MSRPGESEVKKIISSLIISSARGLTVKKLQYDYREMEGRDIPYRNYGFTSFDQYLRSIPDICRVHGNGPQATVEAIITEKVKHINDMINRQKKPKSLSGRRPIPQRARGIEVRNVPPRFQPKSPPLLLPPPTGPIKHGIPPADYYLELKALKQTYKPVTPASSSHFKPIKSDIPKICDTKENLPNNTPVNQAHYSHDKSAQALLASIEKQGTPTPVHYISNESLHDFDDVADEIYDSDDDDSPYYVSGDRSENTVLQQDLSEVPVDRVTQHVKSNLKMLISESPSGIWCSRLTKLYRDRFKEELDIFAFGYQGVSDMCQDLSDIFHVIRPGKTDWKIYDKRKPAPDPSEVEEWHNVLQTYNSYRDMQPTEEPYPQELEQRKLSIMYPKDALTMDDDIEYEWIKDGDVGKYIPIIVSEVYDPSKFWFQLKSKIAELDQLMDDLQAFYAQKDKEYCITIDNAEEGLFVAALFQNEYHRAILLKIYHYDNTARVYYFDYGTVAVVSFTKMFFLHNKFSELPRQAMRGHLSNIMPIEQNTMWTRLSANRFLQLIKQKTLVAWITHVDDEEFILHTDITDVTDATKDIHINDVLVNEGFAVYGNQAEICSTSNAIVANVHLYPTFRELENGDCPNLSELRTFIKLGFSLEQIFKQYFIQIEENIPTFSQHTEILSSVENAEIENIQHVDFNQTSTTKEQIIKENKIEIDNKVKMSKINDSARTKPVISEDNINKNKDIKIPVATSEYLNKHYTPPEVTKNIPNQQPEKPIKPPPGFEKAFPNSQPNNMININQQSQVYPSVPTYDPRQMTYYNTFQPNVNPQMNTIQSQLQALQQWQLVNSLRYLESINNYNRAMGVPRCPPGNFNQSQTGYTPQNYPRVVQQENKTREDLSMSKLSLDSKEVTKDTCIFRITLKNSELHVLKLGNEFYLSTQEIILKLLNSQEMYFSWLQENSLQVSQFPSKVLNLVDFPEIQKELTKYTIPGVGGKINNLGCNVRLTPLNEVPQLVELYGDKSLTGEIKNIVSNITHLR